MSKSVTLDFSKADGLVPAIIQDADSGQVLMLGYMNQEAVDKTVESKKVHFFSRSKNRLWMKGESSGNVLHYVQMAADCDSDALLIQARPEGPTCHNGTTSCFNEAENSALVFLDSLRKIIESRKQCGTEKSYVSSLFREGTKKIAQKVVEEAGELAIEAVADNRELFKQEAADLFFHFLIMLSEKELSLAEVAEVLKKRQRS